ncbi:hypothetical protein PROP_03141 [Propionicimonas sp. T2.31MG-18]|uniref:hypothetical protein n=1 Tax=Propionicimonas sp. T2.31MG-18 TaxID=3157620 RepID=UPI0035E60152
MKRIPMATTLDIVGLSALAAFAWFIWPPMVLLAAGLTLLFVSWRLSGGSAAQLLARIKGARKARAKKPAPPVGFIH